MQVGLALRDCLILNRIQTFYLFKGPFSKDLSIIFLASSKSPKASPCLPLFSFSSNIQQGWTPTFFQHPKVFGWPSSLLILKSLIATKLRKGVQEKKRRKKLRKRSKNWSQSRLHSDSWGDRSWKRKINAIDGYFRLIPNGYP